MPAYRYFDLVMALFVTVLIVSNIASSAKIVDWGFSVFGIRSGAAWMSAGLFVPLKNLQSKLVRIRKS